MRRRLSLRDLVAVGGRVHVFSTESERATMMTPYFELRDVHLDSLRAACAAMEEAISRNPAEQAALHARWAELVESLALGPARELRECPVCRRFGMRDATRCGYCWSALAPFDLAESAKVRG